MSGLPPEKHGMPKSNPRLRDPIAFAGQPSWWLWLDKWAGGVSRKWGDKDGSDMTSRAVSGWGIADEMGFAVGRNGD